MKWHAGETAIFISFDMAMTLTKKQLLFVNKYFECGLNATRAAIAAGYSEATARQQGSRLLTYADIKDEISRRMADYAMSPNEVITRLADQARADIADFIGLDSAKLKEHPQSKLIKKFKSTTTKLDDKVLSERVEIELHNPHDALTTLAKHHGLLKDGITININIDLVMLAWSELQSVGIDPARTFEELINLARARKADRPTSD